MAYNEKLAEGVTYLLNSAGGARVMTVVESIPCQSHRIYLADDHTRDYSPAVVEHMKSLGFDYFPAQKSDFTAEEANRSICFDPNDAGQRDYYSYFLIFLI